MQVTRKDLSLTRVQLLIVADNKSLETIRRQTIEGLAKSVKVQGFREGRAPLALIEKQIDAATLQTEFLDAAVNKFYVDAVESEKLRPVEPPKIELKKFVPFNVLEIQVEVEIVGTVKLPDYTKIKLDKKTVSVTAKDIDEVIGQLQNREAEKREVKRAAADGDEILIDFRGVDAKTKEPINGADGKAYPLILGSNAFIPGFEPELVGLKAGSDKTFEITFPADYGVAALQSRKVSFTVTAKKVSEMVLPKVDETFAAKVGPFKTVEELKADIRKQLAAEREREAMGAFENELVTTIADQSTVDIPPALIDEQLDAMENEERQNLAYRGQTWQEHLSAEGINEQQHRDRLRSQAEQRVKVGLILSEIAEREKIAVTPEELEIRMQILKGQYPDKQMQAELDKPENRRDVLSRLLTEKTLAKLTSYTQLKN